VTSRFPGVVRNGATQLRINLIPDGASRVLARRPEGARYPYRGRFVIEAPKGGGGIWLGDR